MSGDGKQATSRLVPLAAALTALATMVGAVLGIPGLKEKLGEMIGGGSPAASASAAALASDGAGGGQAGPAGQAARTGAGGAGAGQAARIGAGGGGSVDGGVAEPAGGQGSMPDAPEPAAQHADHAPIQNDPVPDAADPEPEPE